MNTRRVYQRRTYAFGTLLLALRMRTTLSQLALATAAGVHRRSFQNWETGTSYPKAGSLQRLIEILFKHGAFTPGQEREEAYTLWQHAAEDGRYPLADFNEAWFASLGDKQTNRHETQDTRHESDAYAQPPALPLSRSPGLGIIDWGEAIAIPVFYGRDRELATLHQWIVDDQCRVVSIVGLGGIGKSSLALHFARRMVDRFERVVFRSLQNGPLLADVLDQTIRAVSEQQITPPNQISDKIAMLVQLFREHRCLLILDNMESIMQPGVFTGNYRAGYDDYGALLRGLSERDHRSCLLLTSREKATELASHEGSTTPVRLLPLIGLDTTACQKLLEDKAVSGSASDLVALTEVYGGNPLALQLIAEPIRELFGSNVGTFLATGDVFFNGVGRLLSEQFARSTALEQTIVRWLAIERELISVNDILAKVRGTVSQRQLLDALESLRRRMLIERAADRPAFTLQPVILEYISDQLVVALSEEIAEHHGTLLRSHPLVQTTAKDYLRRSQERLIATPLLERLISIMGSNSAVEQHLLILLNTLRDEPLSNQGYAPGNIVNLLRLLRGNLRGLDLSRLLIRHAYLQNVDMQDTNVCNTTFQESSFTEDFDITPAVTISRNGTYWATGSRSGEVHIWTASGPTLHRVWRAHMDYIPHASIVFTPDERSLATSAQDGIIKVWDIATGTLRWSGQHAGLTYYILISPDGTTLATFADGKEIEFAFWDIERGTRLLSIPHNRPLASLGWSNDGKLFASGDVEGTVLVWQVHNGLPTSVVQTLTGHSQVVVRLAFSPTANMLASASWDGTVKVWNPESGQLLHTLDGHTDRVNGVTWSSDGRTIASSSRDRTIRLWDVEARSYRAVLQGHTAEVMSLAFTPDSHNLLSTSDDGTLRLWDVASGQCRRVIQGHAVSLRDIDWSPDGKNVVSGGSDALITIWDLASGTPTRTLQGTSALVSGVRWSPDGRRLVSSEWVNTISLWDARSGAYLEEMRPPNLTINFFYSVAWSPDGSQIACGSFTQGIHIIDLSTQSQKWLGPPFPTVVQHVAWSPDGSLIAGGGDDTLYVWNVTDNVLVQQLAGHSNSVTAIAWSPDGTCLASGNGSEGGGLFVWDVQRGERWRALMDHPGTVYAIIWTSDENVLITGGGDGMIRWWDVQRGACVRVCEAHHGTVHALRKSPDGTQFASCGNDGAIMIWDLATGAHLQTLRRDRPYERMNITGAMGLTDAQRTTLRVLGAVENDTA